MIQPSIQIGGLSIKNQPFGLANHGLGPGAFDGIIGFCYPSVAQTDDSSMLDRLVEQGKINKRIGCVKLRKQKESPSEFIIGGCDVEADYWIPVLEINNQRTGWRVNLTKIVFRSKDDNSELLSIEPNNEAVLDTGAGGSVGKQFHQSLNTNIRMYNHFHFQEFRQNS